MSFSPEHFNEYLIVQPSLAMPSERHEAIMNSNCRLLFVENQTVLYSKRVCGGRLLIAPK